MSRRFYLYLRSGIYYAKIVNPETGEIMPGKSTGCRDRDEATATVLQWLKEGIPTGRTRTVKDSRGYFAFNDLLYRLRTEDFSEEERARIVQALIDRGIINSRALEPENEGDSPSFVDWLLNFWDFESGPYVKARIARGGKITRRYVDGMRRLVERHYADYFTDTPKFKVNSDQDLSEFFHYVGRLRKLDAKGNPTDQPIGASSKNRILQAATIALHWQPEVRGYLGEPRRRGILSDDEIRELFTVGDWRGNAAAKLANRLAMETGMRAGEIAGLRVRDLREDRLAIEHSWSPSEGLKDTKTAEKRAVPILPETRRLLVEHARENPWGYDPENYIFYSMDSPGKPMRPETFLKRFIVALESIGISNVERKARGIVFHSWRHKYAKLLASKLDRRAMALLGHRTEAIFEMYAAHQEEIDFRSAAIATSEIFGRILQFPDKEGAG